jgi:hypothetical protein
VSNDTFFVVISRKICYYKLEVDKNMKIKKRRKKKKEHTLKKIAPCILLCLIVLVLAYVIFQTNILAPHINETTASYISFNNKNTTDMLKIKNIEKMSDERGKSVLNQKSVTIKVTGEKKKEYEILLYRNENIIKEKYIKYSLKNKNIEMTNTLEKLPIRADGGMVLYQGMIDNSSIILRMWVSNDYSKSVKENPFEIRIKPR